MAAPKKKPYTADPNLAKENMVKALGLLQQAVATVATPEGIRQHLTFSARGNLHRYSVRNQLLIRQQCPGASEVGGYHYWIKRGRRPLKGEGCRIFAPSIYTKKVEVDPTDPDAPQEAIQNDDGTTTYTIERIMRGWRTLVVWDISKTTDARGNPYVPTAGPAMPAGSTSGFLGSDDDDERAAGIDQFLRDWLGDQGVRVVTALLRPGLYGSWQGATNVLTCSNRYDPITTCSSTVHEAAHFLVDRDKHEAAVGSYNAEELVAEGVAYIVLMRYGLDTSKFSFSYVKQYGADTRTYQKVLGVLQKVAAVVVAALETSPAEDAGEENQEQAA